MHLRPVSYGEFSRGGRCRRPSTPPRPWPLSSARSGATSLSCAGASSRSSWPPPIRRFDARGGNRGLFAHVRHRPLRMELRCLPRAGRGHRPLPLQVLMAEPSRVAPGILEGLTRAQREAVTHETGPLLIIAGAGTGKTTVITRRIAHLIATRRARPSEVLALTFTDKAAAEMEERVDQLVPYGYADVQISTFHAFGDRLIKENALELGLTPDFRVLTRAEQVIFMRDHLFEFPLDHYRPLGDPTRHLQAMITLFSRLKDEDVDPEEYLRHAGQMVTAASDDGTRLEAEEHVELARTYAQYQTLMARRGQVDFGDQIVEALRLFRTRPHVLRRYQRRFTHVLVDEFQDTNYAQNQLVKLLGATHRDLTVVADDDQCLPPGALVRT